MTEVINNDSAELIHQTLLKNINYDQAFTNEGQFYSVSHEQWMGLPQEQRHHVVRTLHQDASKGNGFMYGRHKVDHSTPHAPLADLYNFLNSDSTLDWVREVTGYSEITEASAQATRYIPGQFLTRHNDLNADEQRRVAYVMSFTKDWHSDWGGLLQFHTDNGVPRDAWVPGFNTLSMFDVKHVHGVTYVTPFAAQPRLSVTGWFLAR